MEPTQTPQPQQQTTKITSPEPKANKRKILIGIAAGAVLIGAGVAAYNFFKKDRTTTPQVPSANSVSDTKLNIDTVVEDVRDKYSSELRAIGYINNNVKIKDTSKDQIGVATRLDSYDFFIESTVGSIGFILNSDFSANGGAGADEGYKQLATIGKDIKQYITSQGFKAESTIKQSEAGEHELQIYTKDGLVCNHVFGGSIPDTFSCNELTNLGTAAKKVSPFVKLIKDTSKLSKPITVSLSSNQITREGSNGYTIANIFISPYRVKFFKSEDGTWKLVGLFGYQAPPECTEFGKDPETLKAFADEACSDASGELIILNDQ